MSIKKIGILFKLGLEDLTKNLNVFIYVLFPVLFALLYSNLDTLTNNFTFSLCVLLNIAMVPIALMGTIIAEEKEKNTLRTLMLNNVKAMEVLIAKALICLLFVVLDNILIYFLAGLPLANFLSYQLVGLFVGLAVIFFGAVVGLLAKNQMSAGLLSTPFMLILMAPIFMSMIYNKVISKISSFLPTDAMMTIFHNISSQTITFANTGKPFLIIAGWFIVSIIMFNLVYKRVGVDN